MIGNVSLRSILCFTIFKTSYFSTIIEKSIWFFFQNVILQTGMRLTNEMISSYV
jgi:hypothetical protein